MKELFRAISNFFNRLFGNETQAPEFPPINHPEAKPVINEPIQEKPVTNETAENPKTDTSPIIAAGPSEEQPLALQITLKREHSGVNDTLGKLSINGLYYGYTLEDAKGKCIPTGRYEILLRTGGSGIHATYAAKYKDEHKGMLWLQEVPGFNYIYLQMGLDKADTQGCIILGNAVNSPDNADEKHIVQGGKAAYDAIYAPVTEYITRGGKVFISVE